MYDITSPHAGRIWKIKDANNHETIFRERLGLAKTFAYDMSGRLAKQTQAADVHGQPSEVTQKYYYDSFGNLSGTTDARTYAIDPEALTSVSVYEEGNLVATTNAEGKATVYAYYASQPNAGLLESITDPVLNKTIYEYDSAGNLATVTLKNALNQTVSTTGFTYDANKNLLFENVTRTLANGNPETSTTEHKYDPQNRLIETIDRLRNRTRTVYIDSCQCSFGGNPSATIDALQRQTKYLYAGDGSLAKTIFPAYNNLFNFKGAKRGTGKCSQTLAYRGDCVYASALNYISFGKMNSLCHEKFSTGFVPRLVEKRLADKFITQLS